MSKAPTTTNTNLSTKPQQQKIIQDIEECVKLLVEIFQEQKTPINDDNQTLHRFCAKLEHLFQIDMKDKYTLLGRKKDYWDYLCDCLSSNKGSNDGIKFVKSHGEYKSSIGKGRALLRFSLVHHRLPDSIQQCVINGKVTSDYYFQQSVWLQKEKSSGVIAFLYDLNDVNFDLSSSGYDLDSAWPSFAKKSGGSFTWNPPSRRSSISSMTSVQTTDNASVLNMSMPTFDTFEIDRLNQDLAYSETVKSDLLGQMESLQEKKMLSDQSAWVTQGELMVLQDQLHSNLEKMENTQEKYRDLEKRYDRLNKEKCQIEKDLMMKITIAEESLSRLNTERIKYEDNSQNLKDDLSDSKKQLTEMENVHKKQLLQVETTKADISLELKSCQQEIKSVKELMNKKSEDLQVLENKLSSTESHNQDLLEKLESVLENKGSEASASLEAAAKLGDMLNSLKQTQTENTDLKAKNTQLEIHFSNLQDKLSAAVTQNNNLTVAMETLTKEKDLEEKCHNENIVSTSKEFTNSNDRLEQELKRKEIEITDIQDKLLHVVDNIKDCFSDNNDFHVFKFSDGHFNVQEFCSTLKSCKQKTIVEHKTLENEISSLKLALDNKEKDVSLSAKRREEMEKQLQESKSIIDDLNKSKADLESNFSSEIGNKTCELDDIRTSLQEAESTVLKYKESLKGHEDAILQLMSSLKMENSNNKQIDSLVFLRRISETIKTLNSNMSKLQSENKEFSEKLTLLKTGESDKDAKIMELMKELKVMETCHLRNITEKEQEVQTISESVFRLEDDISKKNKTNISLQKDCDKFTCELSEMKVKNTALLAEKLELENSIKLQQESIQQSCSEKSDILTEKTSLEEQIKNKMSDLDSKNELMNSLKTELSDIKKKNELLDINKMELKNVQNSLGEKLETADQKLIQLNKELEKERKLCAELEMNKNDSELKLAELRQQHDTKKQSCVALQEKCNKYEAERDVLNTRLDVVLNDTQVIKDQLHQTSVELEETSSSKEKVDKENCKTREEINKKTQELETIQQECECLKQELQNLKFSSESTDEENHLLKEELNGLKQELCDSESNIKKMTEESFSRTSRIELMTSQFENQGVELRLFECQTKELDAELTEMRMNFESISVDNSDLENKLVEVNGELSKLETEHKAKSELEKLTEEFKCQVETQNQEISALQFQLSAEQLQHEQIIESYSVQNANQSDLQTQVVEQEKLLENLVQQLGDLKSNAHKEVTLHESQVEIIRKELQKKGVELNLANQKISMTEEQLEEERVDRFQLKGELDALSTTVYSGSTEKDQIIESQKSDINQLKKKLIKVIRDKDALWQMTDQLTYEQRLQAGEVWLDNSTVTKCLACKTEFSLFVRRHHCRLCGKIFCHNCCNNWIMTAHSSKKERACNMCNSRQELLEESSMNSSVLSGQMDSEEEDDLIKSLPAAVDSSSSLHSQSIHESQDEDNSLFDDKNVQTAIENKEEPPDLQDSVLTNSSPTQSDLVSKDHNFHLITSEEISRSISITEQDLMTSSIFAEPSMGSSLLLIAEELERGEVNNQNETIIKPGKTFIVPIKIEKPGTTLIWQFTSKPKDIVFSVKYHSNEPSTLSDCDMLVEPCKCNSHQMAVEGELTAKEPGIYSLFFDNTYSKLTSKTIHYVLQCNTKCD